MDSTMSIERVAIAMQYVETELPVQVIEPQQTAFVASEKPEFVTIWVAHCCFLHSDTQFYNDKQLFDFMVEHMI